MNALNGRVCIPGGFLGVLFRQGLTLKQSEMSCVGSSLPGSDQALVAVNLLSRSIEESEVAAEAIPRIVHGIVAKMGFCYFDKDLC